ncbi:MAG: LysM peptidoglycan-binding domain-containing protein [Mycobacterium sp.]
MGDTLTEGQKLARGESITSNNGAYKLVLQDDGNLVLYARDHAAVWATNTDGQNVVRAEMQSDGNFVLYTPDKPVWASETKGKKDVRLVIQDDRNLVLYSKGDDAVWSSKTDTKEPPPPPAPKPATEPTAAESHQGWGARAVSADRGEGHASRDKGLTQTPPAAQAAPATEPPPAARTYTVASGDTLWAISERFYGDGNQYQRIADASGASNPDLIYPGQVLTIP